MPPSSNFKKWITGFGAIGGAMLFYPNDNHNSWITPPLWQNKWDHNWDRRHSEWSKMTKRDVESDKQIYGETLVKKNADIKYNIILVRHGQYNIEGKTDLDRTLTTLGRQQAEATGKRLQELKLPYDLIVQSTIVRAKETAQIIKNYLRDVTVKEDSGLTEGMPIPPDPPINFWKSDVNFYEDGPRIEAAFRKYFHRPDPNQKKDSYIILVCHANVIRYFVCRALQFPPQGWLRLSLNHASITWISIRPNGRVTLRNLGNSGHMKPYLISSH
ncbi:serine/threonine-protein phosphatase PGAM5, mitochondrial isoform X1 [Osmia lignaria lignaria]|uniref:serine/threonine-protein phosphatase PGAM5, mitochondrial isoform X1 n=1 Tax=Osmia lignaria lignaria TaxID=1437193 RepID=UPI001478EC27|nr:serine/threonine-protein phosphatase PGAM5, mitochondrial-like isoform X1 [Osmia lignaria]XP_034191934.1 serine/threonine-protein phosphatase PGAM5, mitochondrial-like isoform X1 [Osmia lignaria]